MESTCSRCHRTVHAGDCYCPVCGLPQLVFTAEESAGSDQPERPEEAVRDAGSVEWKSALRLVFMLAVPAGVLCSMLSPVGIFGIFLMAATSAWVVALYTRSQRSARLTIGAGARIGLVTGVVGGWTAAAVTGISLYAMRFWLHQGSLFDNFWQSLMKQMNEQMNQQWTSMGVDAQTMTLAKSWMFSPEGRAGWVLFAITFLVIVLLLFAVGGGALGVRLINRARRSAER